MREMIERAIEQINLGAEWILKNAKVDKKKTYRNLIKELCKLEQIRNRSTCDSKATVVLYGQSQCGKSHLASSLLSADDRLAVKNKNGTPYEFLTQLNPQGGGEATGLITRFTFHSQPDITSEFPVHIKLMSIKDIALMICDGYYRDIEKREPFSTEKIKSLLRDLQSRKKPVRQQKYLRVYNISEIEEYFIHSFSQDMYYDLSKDSTDYFGELSMMIEQLADEDVIMALCMLWNNDPDLSRVFEKLFDTCRQLNFADDAYIQFDDLDNSKGKTLLDVGWLDLSDKKTNLQIRFKSSDGNFKTDSVSKTFLAAVCAEVILEVVSLSNDEDEKSKYINFILKEADILDFPGARGRGGLLSAAGYEGTILRRGKVGYYFNKYSSERKIDSLLFCWEPNIFDAKPMEDVLRKWVDVAIGRNAEERTDFMRDMVNEDGVAIPPLFFVGTKFNLHLQAKTDDLEGNTQALDTRWHKWFGEQLSRDIIGVPTNQNINNKNDNYKWFESWTTTNLSFDNCYLLRDFRYSTNIFEGWTSNTRETVRKEGPYQHFYEALKRSFIAHPFVKKHFRDAADRWDGASEVNCDGSLLIARNLASIVDKLAVAAAAKNRRDIFEAMKNVIAELRKHYFDDDKGETLKKALDSAARLQASLDSAFGRDPYYFGRFMKSLTITEYAVHEVFSDVFSKIHEAGNIGDYVYIYMRAPGIKSSNKFDDNLCILRTAYGFSDNKECRDYFKEDLNIDLEDLFRRCEFGLQSPSQMLAADLKEFWFDKWLRVSQRECLSAMLGESTFEELIDMLHSLFLKYEVENRIAQTIHNYVDTFGINVRALSEMISDICAEMINKFVLTVGYEFYSKEDGVLENLKEASSRYGIALNFHFIDVEKYPASNDHIAAMMARMDDMEQIRQLLMNPTAHTVDDLSAAIPGFRQSCRWRDLSKIGYVLTSDIPTYDVDANNLLGQIISKCKTISN